MQLYSIQIVNGEERKEVMNNLTRKEAFFAQSAIKASGLNAQMMQSKH